MDDDIEWKEAKGGQAFTDSENEFDSEDNDANDDELHQDELDSSDEQLGAAKSDTIQDNQSSSNVTKLFSHKQINLSLRRNIVALADANLHKPEPNYFNEGQNEPFDSWLERALVAISPTADILLFAGYSPEKVTFMAKLRQDPINQYTTKNLDIALDYDEHVASLLCLPIMSTQKTAIGLVDWTALVIGLSSGYVKFYTEQSICLLSLKYCDEPVVSLKCQTQKSHSNARSELHFATIADEFLITYKTCAIIVDGLGLYENLRLAKAEVLRNGSDYEPAYNLTNLPSIINCQKWIIDNSRGTSQVVDADMFGTRRTTTFDTFLSNSINSEHVPPNSFARSLIFVGRDPFISCYRESKDYSAHSYTKMIGSLFSLWNKPAPSRIQMTEISNFNISYLTDKNRLATNIVPSPDKRLAIVTDDFGRVMLVDVTNWLVVRIWKGYRSAQCGWIEVKRNPDQRNSPYASFLVFYAPKRGLLEVWSAQRGPRVAAFNVGKNCRLLYCGYKMLNMRSHPSPSNPVEQCYSSHCYLLNAKSENIFCVELPYTYSLCKNGDLKSRDNLLIGELTAAIQQDAEHGLISEILHRIALVESLQKSVEKISLGLSPQKIVPIMENLINKTMKNYDNHSGESMTDDDISIINLCKRVIRLCVVFRELSESSPQELTLPDVNQRLIKQYEEHPQEIDEFSKQLGWSIPEILRYLSLLTLERSYTKSHQSNPWPNLGEPLAWPEFVSCFDLGRITKSSKGIQNNPDKISIKLKEFGNKFLCQDKIVKTALFMYNRISEEFYNLSQIDLSKQANPGDASQLINNYNYIEPPTRLALLLQFWLSSKLCNHWKMWSFLQNQIGQISDELKIIAMSQGDDKILIETWKQMYHLILESDNLFAAIIATAAIKSDTLRMIQDNEKREKIEREEASRTGNGEDNDDDESRSNIDWECLCIDAERMSLLSQQLEDVFLLHLMLRYSPSNGYLIDSYLYKVPRISVSNILRGGPTIVSELIAQWAAQSCVNLKIFSQPYGLQPDAADDQLRRDIESHREHRSMRTNLLFSPKTTDLDKEEHAKELLHHTKTSFPRSLDPDVVLSNCVWEFCRQWAGTNNPGATNKTQFLRKALDCLSLISVAKLRHRLACTAYKTFFQQTFERLVVLVETNSTIVNVKNARFRDTLTRKELSMGQEYLEEFVQFFCDFSEFMLQTCTEGSTAAIAAIATTTTDGKLSLGGEKEELFKETELENRILAHDRWWTTPTAMVMLNESSGRNGQLQLTSLSDTLDNETRRPSSTGYNLEQKLVSGTNTNSFLRITLFASSLLDVNILVELNRLANLVNLIFRLRVVKAYPMSLIGEESRQILQIDMDQYKMRPAAAGSSSNSNSAKLRSLNELRQKFARKCIVNIVGKISEETNEFNEDEWEEDDDGELDRQLNAVGDDCNKDIDTKQLLSSSSASSTLDSRSKHKPQQVAADQAETTNITTKHSSDTMQQSNIGSSRDWNQSTEVGSRRLMLDHDDDDLVGASCLKSENNESMVMFASLLSLANEWGLNCDELHLEFVFELYRCNHDKIAAQMSHRVLDQTTLSSGLLKIASQRVLVMFGLSPHISNPDWRRRSDKWSVFQPNIVSWLKSIQQEEMRREIACLSFPNYLKPTESDNPFNLHRFVLSALRRRTKLMLDSITNHLDGQAARLAHDLFQLLESQLLDKLMLSQESGR